MYGHIQEIRSREQNQIPVQTGGFQPVTRLLLEKVLNAACLGFGRVLWKMSGWLGGIFWPSRIHEDLEFGACLWSWKLDILAGTKKAYYSRTQCASSVRSRKSWQQQVSFFPLPPPPLPPLCSKMFHCGNSADWARDTDRRGRRQYIQHSVMKLKSI